MEAEQSRPIRYFQVGENYVCSICMESNDWRTLRCGHSFCTECLVTLSRVNDGQMPCPLCRMIDETEPRNLPNPDQFQGRLFPLGILDDQRESVTICQLIDILVRQRRITVANLRRVAEELKTHEMRCAGVKIGGSAAGIAGGVMAIVGLSLSLSGVGAIAGVPLGIAGASIAAGGGLLTGGTVAVEYILKKIGIDNIQRELNEDYFRSVQISVLLNRAANDPDFGSRWKIGPAEAASFVAMLPRLAKFSLATAAGVRAAIGVAARGAATTGLHIAGIAFAAALIPFDLAQMVVSSIQIHKNQASEVIRDMIERAELLERDLRSFLVSGNYFHLIMCTDERNEPHWVYIAVHARNLDDFVAMLDENDKLRYEEIIQLGEVIETGIGNEVPEDVRARIQTEWYDNVPVEEDEEKNSGEGE